MNIKNTTIKEKLEGLHHDRKIIDMLIIITKNPNKDSLELINIARQYDKSLKLNQASIYRHCKTLLNLGLIDYTVKIMKAGPTMKKYYSLYRDQCASR